MTVDIHVVQEDEMAVQRPHWSDVAAFQDSDRWARYYRAPFTENGYYCLSWGHMHEACLFLRRAGVLVIIQEPDDWPSPMHTSEDGYRSGDLTDAGRAFLMRGSPIEGTVPLYKLQSNDGWIITPAECGVIAGALATVAEPRWLVDFGQYCAFAALHGGFSVD